MSVSADSEENKALAELNPFRYRGYYYDNETGMYYLNSRYYNPELCRFISADGFSYISNNEKLSLNAYLYCWSNPVTFEDKEGTTPQLSLNIADIILYLKNLNAKIKESAESKIQALKDKCEGIRRNIERTLKLHYNAFIDKLEFAINNPDVVINTVLSKLLNKEVKIRFRLIEFIREKTDLYISLSKLKAPVDEIANEQDSGIAPCYIINDDEKSDNWFVAVMNALITAIEIDEIVDYFHLVDFNELNKDIQELIMEGVTALNTVFMYLKNEFGEAFLNEIKDWSIGNLIEKILGEQISSLLDLFDMFSAIDDAFDNHSPDTSFIMIFVHAFFLVLSSYCPAISIGADMLNDLIDKIIENIDYGIILG